ncbi:MAG: outer membrane lipoprotein chaperone LolA [Magnetococcales bacterium]|nr:outer membrane lipoprotein chaperone LolA [Magnetococcales bacterium]
MGPGLRLRRRGARALLVVFLAAGGAFAAPAGGASPPEAPPAALSKPHPEVDRLQRFLNKLERFEADFHQVQLTASGGEGPRSEGRLYAAKPGRFLWDYRTPFAQQIVSNGTTVWYYEPDLRQVTRTGAEKIKDAPAMFLAQGGKIPDMFRWEVTQERMSDQSTLPMVRLIPLKEGNFQQLGVILDAKRDAVVRMEVVDHLGQRIRIDFSAIRINDPLDEQKFHFTPPPGVDVVEG